MDIRIITLNKMTMKKLFTIAFLAMSITMNAKYHVTPSLASESYRPEELIIIKGINPEYAQMLSYGELSDTNPVQLSACEKVLDMCRDLKILDKKGRKYYKHLKHIHSVSLEMELIEECEMEDKFLDIVMECDEWIDYVDLVYSPRNL